MRRELRTISADGYPFYLHNNGKLVEYWQNYFEQYPLRDDQRVELYIDFPFCRSICKFCVYGSNVISENKEKVAVYEGAMLQLMSELQPIIPQRINNIYFGGGTPTLWSKDTISKMVGMVSNYQLINQRTMEVHPFDLTDEWIEFAANKLKLKTISIGVQSFDSESNRMQHRIPADADKLRRAIHILHDLGLYVNVDIVALFNYDNDLGWDIFKNDLELLASMHPDDICSSVNFRVKNYYDKSILYRGIIKSFMENHHEYSLEHPESISTDIEDVIAYGEEIYHMRTKEYHDFYNNARTGILGSSVESIQENVIMGIGGDINHNSISRLGMKMEDIYSYYDFRRGMFVYRVNKTRVVPPYKPSDKVPVLQVGNCTIDTSLMK